VKKNRLVLFLGIIIILGACFTAPSIPSFSFFESYPSGSNTLVYFSVVNGQGIEYMSACIISNPSDLKDVAVLDYSDTYADSILSVWQNQYNAVTIVSNISILRSDVAMFDLPGDIHSVGILLVGGSGGKYHTIRYFVVDINSEIDRQGFVFTLDANSIEQNIIRLNSEEIKKSYNSSLYKRYGWQKSKDKKQQIGFIAR
jgi:hypothetical protein